jgi:hypothetical protein
VLGHPIVAVSGSIAMHLAARWGAVFAAGLAVACTGSSREPAPTESVPLAAASASSAPSPSATATASASFPIGSASVALVLNPQGLPPYTGPTGSVEGTITVTGPAAPNVPLQTGKCPAALDTYGKLFREGTPATPGGPRPLADAVVVVVGFGENGSYVPEKNDAVKLSIGPNCAYPTRTIAITYGQRLEILNQSSLLFAPMLDDFTAVMVAPPHATDPVKVYPQKAGFFMMTDRMQPFAREDLYVFRHPLHAVTDRAGHYRIDGVPLGKLEVGVYHPGVRAQATSSVDIEANVVTKVDLSLKYAPPPAPPKLTTADGGVLPPWLRPND